MPGNWPSVFFHPEEITLLVVYVDDMKMSGPVKSMDKLLAELGKNIKLEKPKGGDGDTQTFLWCIHRQVDRVVTTEAGVERTIRCMEFDMRSAMAKIR